MIFYGKTFVEKQRDQKGAHYDADTLKLKAEIERLRAENAKLTAEIYSHCDVIDDNVEALDVLKAENARLRAENAKSRADSINLKTAYSELENADRLIVKLRAENEELFEANGKLAYLASQNDRLRAALERLIKDYEDETGERAMAARVALHEETKY